MLEAPGSPSDSLFGFSSVVLGESFLVFLDTDFPFAGLSLSLEEESSLGSISQKDAPRLLIIFGEMVGGLAELPR